MGLIHFEKDWKSMKMITDGKALLSVIVPSAGFKFPYLRTMLAECQGTTSQMFTAEKMLQTRAGVSLLFLEKFYFLTQLPE